mgnify:CR=1 FL=1
MPISRWLSPRVIFPYLYEKKLTNMKIENFNEPWLGRQGEADAFSH